jgi:outer membrane protein OmpA-like peptidoglycan-associated protein
MSCKCKKPSECEECPEWIFTFADLVMLMMGFFVILWVTKPSANPKPGGPAKEDDLIKVEAAIREAFGYVPNPASNDPVDMQMLLKKLQQVNHAGPGEKGRAPRTHEGAEGVEQEVTNIRQSKQATMGGRLIFDAGESTMRPELTRSLDEVAELVRGHRNIVMIKGHTALDDLAATATEQQRMDLSLHRAQAVANYLISKGVSPEILRVQGCSTYEPVAQRAYTDAGRAANRRVEVEATAALADAYETPASTQPTLSPTNSQ